ncbi:hypothetical protein [Niallia endozanthoxylica]|uniref:hypothetical protein n=1 Tax=Niallia endozanthoxylica TaxID=2036016 RepID=UPI00168BC006|nr:hypothetical protein [Niallia endozanthoxylica]
MIISQGVREMSKKKKKERYGEYVWNRTVPYQIAGSIGTAFVVLNDGQILFSIKTTGKKGLKFHIVID